MLCWLIPYNMHWLNTSLFNSVFIWCQPRDLKWTPSSRYFFPHHNSIFKQTKILITKTFFLLNLIVSTSKYMVTFFFFPPLSLDFVDNSFKCNYWAASFSSAFFPKRCQLEWIVSVISLAARLHALSRKSYAIIVPEIQLSPVWIFQPAVCTSGKR